MRLSLRVLAAVGIATVWGLFVTAAAWSRAPSQGSPTATAAGATVVLAATTVPAPGVKPTPTPTPTPIAATGTPAATNTAVATVEVPGAGRLKNGWFFPLPEGAPYRGFAVLDEQDGPAFATAYQQNGGFAALGRPVTRSFQLTDGAIYQVFAYGLLRWQPGTVAVTMVDVLEFTTLHDLEGQLWWLGVPRRAPPRDDRHTLTPAPSVRLQWLTEPAIVAHYRGSSPADGQEGADSEQESVPPGQARYGWPESRPEHSGSYIAQRFERAVLIVWVIPTADGPPTGTVEVLPLGPLVARMSVFQGLATAPDTLVGGRLVARAPRPALNWPVLPTPTPTAVPPTATATPEAVSMAAGAALRVVTVFNEGRREYVVITNEGSQAQNLQGWVLESAPSGRQRYTFPAVTLGPGATLRVHSGRGSAAAAAPPTDLAWTGRNVWNNRGDTAVLLDPNGREVSRFSY